MKEIVLNESTHSRLSRLLVLSGGADFFLFFPNTLLTTPQGLWYNTGVFGAWCSERQQERTRK